MLHRSLEAGFDGHLVKPVVPAELLALVDGARPALDKAGGNPENPRSSDRESVPRAAPPKG